MAVYHYQSKKKFFRLIFRSSLWIINFILDRPRKKKRPRELKVLALEIVKVATEGEPAEEASDKNPHAVALGRLGGQKGGKARAAKLTPKERKDNARKATKARWEKKTT